MNSSEAAQHPRKKFRLWKWVLWLVGGLIGLILLLVAVLWLSEPAREWTATRILTHAMVLNGRLADVPTRTEPQPVRKLMLPVRDGVELSTEVFLPEGDGPWPVIVVRDPYSFAQYLSCKVFVLYDYACVYQEVRGRGPSQGTWYPFIDEREDGLEALDWILRQPWQNGRIALHGGSYLGATQWAVAGDLPPEVKTFAPTVAHGDVYQLSYRNGLFNQGVPGPWLHSQFRSVIGQFTSTGNWRDRVASHFPASDVDPAEFGKTWAPYRDYILHPDRDDPYWQSPAYVALREAHRNVRVPVLMIGYANDFFLPGMLQTFEELPTRDQSVFVIGPGNHGGQAEDEIAGTYTQDYADTLAWFDHHLKGEPLPDRLKPGINVYVHGDDSWRQFQSWPERSRVLALNLDELAKARACDGGALTPGPPAGGQMAHFAYDPRNPVPTLGGAFVLIDTVAPAAVEEQGSEICARADVLSFSSEPLPADTLVLGGMQVRLRVASDAADTAFTVKISEHFADGRVYNIRDDASTLSMRNGATHRMDYHPGEQVEVVFDLTPIAWQLKAGSRLRLDVSSSNWPAFFPHPNRAGLWSQIADPVVAQQTLFGGSVEIPVADRPEAVAVPESATQQRCAGLQGSQLGFGTVTEVGHVARGEELVSAARREMLKAMLPFELPPLPAPTDFCRVWAELSPVAGSLIKVQAWLPDDWNGKMLAKGGGGFNGGMFSASVTMKDGAARGYATVVTDVGHEMSDSARFAYESMEQFIDYGYRGNHATAAFTKDLIEAYYGKPARLAYFEGGSNGGREALMEARRFPGDYDGIIAGMPAMSFTRLMTTFLWNDQAANSAPGLKDKLGLVSEAVLRNCDALDGVNDGVLENPLSCMFNLSEIQCKGGDAADCLTATELGALQKIHDGPRLEDGTELLPGLPAGSEAHPTEMEFWIFNENAVQLAMGQEFFRWMVHGDPEWDKSRFDIDRDWPAAAKVAEILDSDDPDLSGFLQRGGKLIIHHGWNDAAIPAGSTLNYHDAVLEKNGATAEQQVRLFMVPGMGHGTGRPGPDEYDMLTELDRWVEGGPAPERISTRQYDSPASLFGIDPAAKVVRTRPLCAWPKVAHYDGSGSADDEASFSCK